MRVAIFFSRLAPLFAFLAVVASPATAAGNATIVWGSSTISGEAPGISFQPTVQSAILGGRAIFTVIASGDAPLAYQWRKGRLDLSDGANVSGATADVLILADVGFDDAGDYSVEVTNAFGRTLSNDATLAVSLPQGGDVDFSFDPGSSIDGEAYSIAVQSDGRVLIGGFFTSVHGAARGGIARLNPDGTTDHTFQNTMTGANDWVYSMALQPDGRVLIGGFFTTVNGVSRNRIARLNADGSLDTTFQNGMTGVDVEVSSLVLQPDGRVLIGGGFSTVNGVSRNRIARLNADGSLDTTFQNGMSGANISVSSLVLQPDGRVLMGGPFTTVNGASHNRIARLNADGSLDTTFQNGMTGANDWVYSVALQPDGRVLIGGNFSTVNGVGRNRIARLNADGSLDMTFQNGTVGGNSSVVSVALQPDGRVLIGGNFSTVNGVSRNRIARLNADGSLDPTFQNEMSGANSWVVSLALQLDGRVLIGGSFMTVNGASRNRIARLNTDGSLDTTFQNGMTGPDSSVHSVMLQPDGRVLIGGAFGIVNGVSRNGIARLNADGSLDTTFQNGMSGANIYVYSVALQPDGRVLIGGEFTMVNGVSRNRIARLNTDGSLDTTFQNGMSGVNNLVSSVALQADGRLLIGGVFTTVNGVSRNRIARLNTDGSLDTTFQDGRTGANSGVSSVMLQPDGRVLIGGSFTTVNGVSRNRIARLNSDGTLDTTFQNGMTGPDSSVRSVVLQADSCVLIGGFFTTVNGVSRNGIARLNADGSLDTTFQDGLIGTNDWVNSVALQADGRVLIGGIFTAANGVSRNRIARLNADGSLDTTFLNGFTGANDDVWPIAVQPDGRVLIGGRFSIVNGVSRSFIARLHGSTPVAPSITSQPSDQASHDACCAVFHVAATGTPLDYRWRKDGVDLSDGGTISGATSASLTLAGVTPADAGAYSVVVSNVLSSDTSDDATLTVAALPECWIASCDPVLGCVLSVALDGTSCDDGSVCTGGDTCLSGACQGAGCACESAPDTDGDGVCSDLDNCPSASNPISDCDANVGTPDEQCDDDADGRGNPCDNCPVDFNPGQQDPDGDLLGNVCDPDMDGDGIANVADPDQDADGVPEDDGDGGSDPCAWLVLVNCDDNCREVPNPDQFDGDSDGEGSVCDFDDGEAGGGTILVHGAPGSSMAYLLVWELETGALGYNVYRGLLGELRSTFSGACYRSDLPGTQTAIPETPAAGEGYFYLITAKMPGGEGSLGHDGNGVQRVLTHPCE